MRTQAVAFGFVHGMACGVLLGACGPLGQAREPAAPAAAPSPDPQIDYAGGYRGVLAASDLDGRVVGPLPADKHATVIVVFASWCGPCRHELGLLGELAAREPRLRVIGVNAYEEWGDRSDEARLRAYLADSAPWLQVVRADDALMTALGSPTRVPSVYVFDRAGQLVRAYLRERGDPPDKAELSAVLARTMGGA